MDPSTPLRSGRDDNSHTMNTHLKKTFLLGASLVLAGQGCISINTGGGNNSLGGIFKSVDHGVKWAQKASIASVGTARGFGNSNVTDIAFDPSDRNAIYVGTADLGLRYSYDKAESWRTVPALGTSWINAIAISPGDKCVVYAAIGRRLSRTRDCARTWEDVYFDARAETQITDIVVDHFNADNVYASTTAGDVLKSGDRGASWSTIRRLESDIRQLHMSAGDSRVLFATTRSKGIWRTDDSGANWKDLSPALGDYAGSLDDMILAQAVSKPGTYVLASHYGLLRTTDNGDNWKPIPLVTAPGATVIYSVTVSPKDDNHIWYGTASNLIRTENGGAKWGSARLPTARAATDLAVDPNDDSVLYMGTTLIEQKSTPF